MAYPHNCLLFLGESLGKRPLFLCDYAAFDDSAATSQDNAHGVVLGGIFCG